MGEWFEKDSDTLPPYTVETDRSVCDTSSTWLNGVGAENIRKPTTCERERE